MTSLKYHQAALSMVGAKVELSTRRIAVIEEREAACGARFPESVREWFCVDSAESLFHENTNEDHLQELAKLGDPREAAQGYLQVATENQSVVAWYVRLNEGDNPPVYHNNDQWNEDLSVTDWQETSKTFANFIFDSLATNHFNGWHTGMRLSAVDQRPGPDELRQLRSLLQEGPTTDEPDSKVYRFFTRAGLVTIRSVQPELLARGEAEWALEARSATDLFELGKHLWQMGALSHTLKAESCAPNFRAEGDLVLRRLRAELGE